MQNLSRLVNKVGVKKPLNFAFGNLNYAFGKMLKLTPRSIEMNSEQTISQTIIKGGQILGKIARNKLWAQSIKQKEQQYQEKEFIKLIKNMDIRDFEQNLIKMNPLQANQVLQAINKQRLLHNGMQILINNKSFEKQHKQYATKLFMLIACLFKRAIYDIKKVSMLDSSFFRNFMESYNQYFVILDINSKMVFDYIFLTNYLISTGNIDSNHSYFINQKIIIDYILQNRNKISINRQDFYPLFGYAVLANVNSHYPTKYHEFVKFLLENLDKQWDKQQFYKPRFKNMIKSISLLNYKSVKIMRGIQNLMTEEPTQRNCNVVSSALRTYINLTAEAYLNKPVPEQIIRSLKNITRFIKSNAAKDKTGILTEKLTEKKQISKLEQNIYKDLVPVLYRASIWAQEFWILYGDWLATERNHQKMKIIDVYTVFDLMKIDRDLIPGTVVQRFEDCKKKLLMVNNFRIEDVDLTKLYYKQYGQNIKTHYSIQQQVANNLRSISGTNIKTQILINFFLVDILLNERTVIQINNQLHYIVDLESNVKVVNLKSAFRKRIIEKLGYQFLQFEIDTFIEGNHEFLKTVKKIVSNTGNNKKD